MKILAFCNTIEFQNRATFEAINYNFSCIDVLCKVHLKDILKKKIKSNQIKIDYLVTLLPGRFRRIKLLQKFELIILKKILNKKIKQYDIFLFTSPHVAFLLPLISHQKIINLIIDPHYLMSNGKTYINEKQLLDRADLVLTTSKLLKEKYIPKYFKKKTDNVYYWPNTVDLSIWNYNKFIKYRRISDKIVIGYAGNMNEITTDLPLLDKITTHFANYKFELAGNLNFKHEENKIEMNKIIAKNNVDYLGFIPYRELPIKVINWSLCIMFDVHSEISEYVHHNKIYQYLALGKPVIANRTHSDYDMMQQCVYLADNKNDFLQKISIAISNLNNNEYPSNFIELAKANSSIVRAHQFIDILNKL